MTDDNNFHYDDSIIDEDNNVLTDDFLKLGQIPIPMLEWFIDHSGSVIAIWSSSGILQFISRSAKYIFNKNPEDLVGRSWKNIIPQETVKYMRDNFTKDAKKPQKIQINLKQEQCDHM